MMAKSLKAVDAGRRRTLKPEAPHAACRMCWANNNIVTIHSLARFLCNKMKRFPILLVLASTIIANGFRIITLQNTFSSRNKVCLSATYDIEAASEKLLWETVEESSRRPVLDLSSPDFPPEDNDAAPGKMMDTSAWDQGQQWHVTKQGLQDMGVIPDESFVTQCPQLLRLEPSLVLKTAEYVIQEFSREYLEREPRLLSFPSKDVSYGMEFLGLMMMIKDAKPLCAAAPEMLLTGIEGGIQEQAVKNALGSAATATTKASQTIAGDAMTSLKNLQQQKRKGL